MPSLKKIQITGFKSFADNTEINFDEGITAIVGPNGCGKSNVVDAVKWVLGEKSKKEVRGENRMDMIFSGTQMRKAASYCEVSISFDNTRRFFNVDVDDLTISRRLHRTGVSGYYINGAPARLKDIISMIRDTGVGKEGYSIIAQGKVQAIMLAKPTDRRLIFEEAAGCATFREDKKVAERSLENTSRNIEKLESEKDSREESLKYLRTEAERAQKHRDLSEELRSLEINAFLYLMDNLDLRRNEYNQQIAASTEELQALNAQLAKVEVEYANCADLRTQYTDRIEACREGIFRLELEGTNKKGELSVVKTKLDHARADLKKTQTALNDGNSAAETKRSQIQSVTAELTAHQSELSACDEQYNIIDREQSRLTTELIMARQQMDDNSENMIAFQRKISDTQVNIAQLRTELRNLETKRDENAAAIDKFTAQLMEYESEKQATERRLANLNAERERLSRQTAMLSNQANSMRFSLREAETKIVTLMGKIKSLEGQAEVYSMYEGFKPVVQRLMDDASEDPRLRSKIDGIVADIFKVKNSSHIVAVEAVIGGNIQNIVVRNEEISNDLIDYVKQRQYGRITTMPLTSVKGRFMEPSLLQDVLAERGVVGQLSDLVTYDKRYDVVIAHLLGRTMLVDTKANALALARKYHYTFKIATLDGTVYNNAGIISGGQEAKAGLLQAKSAKDVGASIKQLRLELTAAEEDRDEFRDELESFEQDLESYAGRNHTVAIEHASQTEKLDAIVRAMEGINSEISDVEKVQGTIVERIKAIQTDLDMYDMADKYLTTDSQKAGNVKGDMKSKADTISKQLDAIRVKREKCVAERAVIETNINNVKDSLVRLNTELNELEESIKTATAQIADLNTQIAELADKYEELSATLFVDAAPNTELAAEIEELKQKRDENDTYYKRLDEDRRVLSNRANTAREMIARAETKRDNLIETSVIQKDKMMSSYGVDYESAEIYRREDFDNDAAKGAIDSLTGQLRRLGQVSDNAIAEYDLRSKEFADILAEYEDLVKAKADLELNIESLSKRMLEQFNEKFSQINENFKIVFSQLFDGGNAKLVLQESEDPLEAGVEIYAQPPGKTLKSLLSLSGGEQALTAIAILFAILRLKPLPFCILDEIEAALDDYNVRHFAKYLRRYSQQTQFIVITHRKPTMELADVLYGVTMQERGISKVVSIHLEDAAQYAKTKEEAAAAADEKPTGDKK